MHPLDCSLLEIVQEVVGAFASAARKRSVDLRIVEFPPDTIRAFCDSTRAAQILENLVENAIKFTNPGGSVCVSASRKGNDIEVAVTDTGIGISPEHLPRIFDRFWQAKESAYKGIGLGLAISKALTEAQGGTISVRSIEGQGTSVLFTLPSGSFAPRKLKAS
jgi:signal transduction histidine kinase